MEREGALGKAVTHKMRLIIIPILQNYSQDKISSCV